MALTVTHGIDDSGIATKRPTRGYDGGHFYETDTLGLRRFRDAALVWNPFEYVAFSYDFATEGGVVGDITLSAAVPAGCVVLDGIIDVITTFTSAASTATVALKVEAANDIVSAIAINDGSSPWNAGRKNIVPSGSAANGKKATAARSVVMTIGVQALTAGKMRGFLRCLRSTTT